MERKCVLLVTYSDRRANKINDTANWSRLGATPLSLELWSQTYPCSGWCGAWKQPKSKLPRQK